MKCVIERKNKVGMEFLNGRDVGQENIILKYKQTV